nr:diphosphomevalonate decarboxylase [Seculamonas ecuadoriensis]
MWSEWSQYANGAFCSLPADQQHDAVYAECTAPVNIAVIKYWGKRDEDLILPVNSSLSVTLDQADLCTRTLVVLSPHFESDGMWLNDKEAHDELAGSRLRACIAAVRGRADARFSAYRIRVWTRNNFPTAAGLASSASGLACFVYTLAKALNVKEEFEGELSSVARQGSGSACRSWFGGFVKWEMGVKADGSDSVAVQVDPETHWPEMRAILLVASDKKKGTPSTSGMKTTVDTSPLLKYRADVVVPERMRQMETAIHERDFETFAKLTMMDSNQFHAVCLDTYPPISYLNDTSRMIMALIHAYNAAVGETRVCYTYDAGPNAVLYLLEKDLNAVLSLIMYAYPPSEIPLEEYFPQRSFLENIGLDSMDNIAAHTLPSAIVDKLPVQLRARTTDALKYIMVTRAGPGPQTVVSSHQ